MKIFLMLFFIFFVSFFTFSFAFEPISIIANKDVKVSSVDLATLKNIYLLDVSALGGKKIKLFDYSGESGTVKSFYTNLGKSQSDHKKLWLKAKLTGSGDPPTVVSSDAEMISKVSTTSGGFGYVSSSNVTGDVKVLFEIK